MSCESCMGLGFGASAPARKATEAAALVMNPPFEVRHVTSIHDFRGLQGVYLA